MAAAARLFDCEPPDAGPCVLLAYATRKTWPFFSSVIPFVASRAFVASSTCRNRMWKIVSNYTSEKEKLDSFITNTTYWMEMDEGKTSRDMSKLISNKADILQRNSMKMCREKKKEKSYQHRHHSSRTNPQILALKCKPRRFELDRWSLPPNYLEDDVVRTCFIGFDLIVRCQFCSNNRLT